MTDPTTDQDIADFTAALENLKEVEARLVAAGKAAQVAPELIAEPLYVSARLFSAKTDRAGKSEWYVGKDALNATDTVVLVTALLEAADVNLFDMAIWYRRAE